MTTDFEFSHVDGKHNSVQEKAVAQYDHFISLVWRSEPFLTNLSDKINIQNGNS